MSLNPTREQTREYSIEAWMLMIIRDGGVVRMDDLHVDKIDEAWKARKWDAALRHLFNALFAPCLRRSLSAARES